MNNVSPKKLKTKITYYKRKREDWKKGKGVSKRIGVINKGNCLIPKNFFASFPP